MGKRHNRKRTRSRPRHRDGSGAQPQNHTRSFSVGANSSISSTSITSPFPPPSYYPTTTNIPANHWHQTYSMWQTRLCYEQEREHALEMLRLRMFGGLPGDEVSLFEPMLKVVTDLFDGDTDYQDP